MTVSRNNLSLDLDLWYKEKAHFVFEKYTVI